MANDTKGQVENILTELGKKIDQLISETKDASKDVREEVETKISDLKKKKAGIEKDFEKYKEANGDRWKEAKGHLSTALGEVIKAAEKVFKEANK